MKVNGQRASLVAASVVFLIFLSNVALGGAGSTTFLNDVGDALTLFTAVLLFVVAILLAEKSAKPAKR